MPQIKYAPCREDWLMDLHETLVRYSPLQGNMHIAAAEGTPMANAFVSLMNGLGHELNSFGDSNGALDLSMSRAVTSTGAAV